MLKLDPATLGWALGAPSGKGEMRSWFGLADGRDPDPLSLLLAVDALPPTAFELGISGWVPTVELTVHVRCRPAPGPLRVSITTRNLARRLPGGGRRGVGQLGPAGRAVPTARPGPAQLSGRHQVGREPSVGVGPFGGRHRRVERQLLVVAPLVRQHAPGDPERELGQLRIECERPSEGLGEVPRVGDGLHHIAGQGDTSGGLAPRHGDEGVQARVVRPGLPDLRPDLVVRRAPAVVLDAVEEGSYGHSVTARADHGDPAGTARDVRQQGPYVELGARGGTGELLRANRRDQSGDLLGGAGVEGAGVDVHGGPLSA